MQNYLGVSEINVHLFLCHLVTKVVFSFFWISFQPGRLWRRGSRKVKMWGDQDWKVESERVLSTGEVSSGRTRTTEPRPTDRWRFSSHSSAPGKRHKGKKSNDLLWLLFLLWTRFLPTALGGICITSNRIVSKKHCSNYKAFLYPQVIKIAFLWTISLCNVMYESSN